jgi:hypothetical protein
MQYKSEKRRLFIIIKDLVIRKPEQIIRKRESG